MVASFGERKLSGVLRESVFWCLALEKAVFGSRVLGDKSQLVFLWLDLARKMYQTDNVGRTCLLCYSYQKTAAGASKVLLLSFGDLVLSLRS